MSISITALMSGALIFLIVAVWTVVSVMMFGRPRSANPATSSRWGFALLGCYAVLCVAAFLVWGYDADGRGIAMLLLGMPWSVGSAAILNLISPGGVGIFGISWYTAITVVSILCIVFNARLAYRLGQALEQRLGRQPEVV